MADRVVADAGPVIHLDEAGVLRFLDEFGELVIPETVLAELHESTRDSLRTIEFTSESVDRPSEVLPSLDPGETAAVLLSERIDAILLTDDLEARDLASERGIEVHGSIGIVLRAYARGDLDSAAAKAVIRDLERDTTLYLSDPLVEYALDLVDEDEAGW